MMNVDFERVLNVGIALSTERDRNKLLELIITEAMEISHADAGTLYVCEGDFLRFKIMRTHSLGVYRGGEGEEIDLPPVPMSLENVCSYTALTRETVNIEDVRHSDKFDFSGPQRYDQITGYRTRSMLVVPFGNTIGDIIGVLQLINACDENKEVVPFSQDITTIVTSLASQAAIAITNSLYLQDIKSLFQSFVEVMSTAIDEISPYNVSHTKNIALYTDCFVDYLNELYATGTYGEYFDANRKEQLIMSVWLHDIGKMITPTQVMNKPTRLAEHIQTVTDRFTLMQALARLELAEHKVTQQDYHARIDAIASALAQISQANKSPSVDYATVQSLTAIAQHTFINLDGNHVNWLTPDELEQLSVPYGTLTEGERVIMKHHVVLTSKLLSKIKFSKDLSNVPTWAGMHHEFLDGSGYPDGLHAPQICTEVRILSLLDIYDALTSDDRPYKCPMSQQAALKTLAKMADDGKLDAYLVGLWKDCCAANVEITTYNP